VFDWGNLHWAFTYLTIGTVALWLQHKTNSIALEKLSQEHEKHTADLKFMIEILQLALMHEQEVKARPNRVTHAEAEL